MFLGHHAVAFASKKAVPKVKLGTLIFAAQFLDLLWPLLLLANIEHVRIIRNELPFLRLDLYDYPISHSLLMVLIWSFLIGGAYFLINKQKRGAVVVGFAVFSHWALDFISHAPDLPIIPNWNYFVGLGLWNSTLATISIEVALFLTGIYFYLHCTRAKDRIGKFATWTLIIFLAISYAASIFFPPPSNVEPIGWMALSQWLFVPWGYWIDRHRINIES